MKQDSGIIRLMQFSLIFINEIYIESLISLLKVHPIRIYAYGAISHIDDGNEEVAGGKNPPLSHTCLCDRDL